MIILKFLKTDSYSYLSHRDVLHDFCRTIRRADLKVDYSVGFNPHMRIFFSNPMSLAVDSECEYACVESGENAQSFLQKFNEHNSMTKILLAKNVQKNPNFAEILIANRFEYTCENLITYEYLLKNSMIDTNFMLAYGEKTVSVNDKIINFEIEKNKVILTSKSNRDNLKVNELVAFWERETKMQGKLVRINQYYQKDDLLIDADELFKDYV